MRKAPILHPKQPGFARDAGTQLKRFTRQNPRIVGSSPSSRVESEVL